MKSRFFDDSNVSHIKIVGIFVIKLFVAFLLVKIYSKYYKDRSTADIFKYFDDSKYIYQSLFINPRHFLQLVFGYHCDAHYLDVYTAKTINWKNQTDEYLKATNSMNFHFFESNRLMTRLNAIIRLFSFGIYSVHCIIILFIEMFGLFALFKVFKSFVSENSKLLVLCIFFTPSILLWSSGILKESIVFLGFGFFLYYFFSLQQTIKLKAILGLLLSFIIILITKYYLIIAIIPSITAYYIAKKLNHKYLIMNYIIVNSVLLICVLNINCIYPTINPIEILKKKQNIAIMSSKGGAYYTFNGRMKDTVYFSSDEMVHLNLQKNISTLPKGINYKFIRNGILSNTFSQTTGDSTLFYQLFYYSKAGSYIELEKINTHSFLDFLAIPKSIFNAACQPLQLHKQNPFVLLSFIEMLFVGLFLVLCFVFCKRTIAYKNELFFCINLSLVLYLIIGLTTPVIGSIVRFRIFSLLLVLIAGLIILDGKKLKIFISKMSPF